MAGMGIQEVAQIAGALGIGSALPWVFRTTLRLMSGSAEREQSRSQNLEQLVEVLRRALDKVRLREDALAQVLGVLIFGLRQVEDLSPAISDAIERAIEILEGAQDRLVRINERDAS
jgi:hypothetical protein